MEEIKQFKETNSPKLIYIDQNHWSKLERVYHEIERDSIVENLLEKIFDLKENGKIKILIDINRKIETSQRDIKETRERLTDLMLELSDGYFVLPFLVLEEFEIMNYFSRKLGIRQYNILDLAIGQEFQHLMVGEPSISSDEIDKDELNQINHKIHELIQNPSFIKDIFCKPSERDDESKLKYIRDAENVRIPLYSMETNRERKIYQTTHDFTHLMRKIFKTYKVTDDYIGKIPDIDRASNALMLRNNIPRNLGEYKDRLKFMKNFPMFYTHCTLIGFRDRDLRRQIQANDLIDIVSFVLPIVYFNVVVGETYFINLAKQAKLDSEYNSALFSKLLELKEYLENLS